jgi:hypothetical protein
MRTQTGYFANPLALETNDGTQRHKQKQAQHCFQPQITQFASFFFAVFLTK